ncbi:O-antigen/teichoic acid export membrane protein [Novosphingobium chloroacetimidivorans]|uniref:O-antigen/teichoic acid export membrane protein n=1 Tax=Novosphingobium chloroacetimidivorans TaxID=1428314 RepID=A0A7W7K9C3_9SPHN|nr:lipopolysaccharide biosynthesis protein [Novosphingobium chloroacetimidivorans]MBB4858114.1 O-antigen/teichoic acid export membrane protein [Novosphingobium chloroacetimidivorans]
MIRRVAAGIGMTAFDKLVVAGTQLLLVPILAGHWGLELYGQWLILATLPQFLSISDFGFATAAGTRMTMAAAQGDRQEAMRIFQSAWRAILLTSTGMIVLVLLLALCLPSALFGAHPVAPVEDLRLTMAVLGLYGVVAVQGGIFFAGFRAAQLFPIGAFWNAIVLLIENAALIITVASGGGPLAAAWAWLVGRLIGLAGQNWLLRRKVPWLTIGLARGSWKEARALLAPAGAIMLMPVAQAVVLQGTALVVGAVAGQGAVPVFAAARTLSRVGMQLCWIVSTPLMPEFSAAAAREDRQAMAAMVLALMLVSAALVLPYALGFALLGGPAIALWTHGAIQAPAALVAAMGLAIAAGGLWYPLSTLMLARDRQARYTGWYLALSLASLSLAGGLVAMLGVSGGGIGLAVLDLAMLVVVARLACRHLATPAELRQACRAVWRTIQARRARLAR